MPRVVRDRGDQRLTRRLASVAVALPDHPWLDRVIRGRAWIPLLGVLLAGIVAAQVEILKLGANLGRALEQTTTLTTQDEQLRGNVAQLADDQRIERVAAAMGLVLPPPGAVGYLAAKRGGDVSRALASIHTPDAAAFVAMTPHNGALVTGPNASTLPAPLGTPPPPVASTAIPGATAAASTPGAQATPTGTATPTASTTPNASTTPTVSTTSAAASAAPSAATSASASSASTTASSTAPPTSTQTPNPTPPPDAPATGAAAIQPSGISQPSGGG